MTCWKFWLRRWGSPTLPSSALRGFRRRNATAHLRQLGAMLAAEGSAWLRRQGVPGATLLVSLDQAEELVQGEPADDRLGEAGWALAVLRAVAEAPGSPFLLLWTLRADSLGLVQAHPAMADAVFDRPMAFDDFKVGPLGPGALRAVVLEPAARAGIEVEPALVDRIVDDARGANALPLVAYTLERLWDRYKTPLTLEQYEQRGGLTRAVRDAADRIVHGFAADSPELQGLRAAFVPGLVRLDAEGRPRRRAARLDRLPAVAQPLLAQFVEERLLAADTDADGHQILEVAHEALLDAWPTLAAWLEEDRDNLRRFEALLAAAREWRAAREREDLLLHRDARLAEVEALAREPRFAPPPDEPAADYLAACRAAQDAREAAAREEQERRVRDAERFAQSQRRIARRTGIGLAAAVVLAVLAGWQWFDPAPTAPRPIAAKRRVSATLQKPNETAPNTTSVSPLTRRRGWSSTSPEGFVPWRACPLRACGVFFRRWKR